MLKTVYDISNIVKRYHKSIISQSDKNISENTEIITGLVL